MSHMLLLLLVVVVVMVVVVDTASGEASEAEVCAGSEGGEKLEIADDNDSASDSSFLCSETTVAAAT